VNFRNKPELHERLAAEYALGTLRGAARRRFEQWMREDAALAMTVARWETRLAPMSGAVQPVQPPARVWRKIRERTNPDGSAQGLWNSVGFWRSLGLAASGMVAALLVTTLLVSPQAPQSTQPPAALAPAGTIVASYLAILSDAKTQKPVLVVSAGRKSDQLWFRALDPAIQVAGKSLELWALPRSGAPKSLGLVAGEEGKLTLVAAADESLGEIPALAVSLEPAGGSPTGAPTGPVLFSGPCVKYW
jgi:anti-sigma-K factor RskA